MMTYRKITRRRPPRPTRKWLDKRMALAREWLNMIGHPADPFARIR